MCICVYVCMYIYMYIYVQWLYHQEYIDSTSYCPNPFPLMAYTNPQKYELCISYWIDSCLGWDHIPSGLRFPTPVRTGWWLTPTPLKNMKVNGKDDIPYMKWKIKFHGSKPPTRYLQIASGLSSWWRSAILGHLKLTKIHQAMDHGLVPPLPEHLILRWAKLPVNHPKNGGQNGHVSQLWVPNLLLSLLTTTPSAIPKP